MLNPLNRRDFLAASTAAAALTLASPATNVLGAMKKPEDEPPFKISLAQWSLNREIRGGKLDNLEFAKTAKDLGIEAIEYVNQFFKDIFLESEISRLEELLSLRNLGFFGRDFLTWILLQKELNPAFIKSDQIFFALMTKPEYFPGSLLALFR